MFGVLFLFSFLFGGCSSATLSFLFLRRWGHPNPLWFGFPLVTLPRGRGLRPRPEHRHAHLHSGHLPHLHRFFFFAASASLFGFGGSLFSFFLSLSLFISLSLSFSFSSGLPSVWSWALGWPCTVHALVKDFPPSRRGKCCLFLSFLFFCAGFGT